ncbi:MAG: penicillin-binding protein 2 [Candidatus Harrisonbacteria bacterium]|nr:penicillin-binding protein 2 [Candidatus Harrisonbacteria bacterium]
MRHWRIWLITAIFVFGYTALVVNIYNLQIKRGGYYLARAESQSRNLDYFNSLRGNVYFKDRNNNLIPAAINKEYSVIYGVPKEITDPAEAAALLSPILKQPVDQIEAKFIKPDDLYELLLAKASSEEVAAVQNLNLPGVYIDNQRFRFYPFGKLASHLIGYVGPNDINGTFEGYYGIESRYEAALNKQENVTLTIDRNIQSQAEQILKNLVENFSASGGTVIVQEPKTGKILTMANWPDFDPNNYSESPIKNFLNPAIQSVYEPGSVFKILTMAAGVDSGRITPDTTYYDSGSVTINDKKIENWDKKAYGRATMTNVIEHSINTGAVFAERQTGHDFFYNYILGFGFGSLTGIDLSGEVAGDLRNLKSSFRDINFATAAFGQGVSVTPLQLINAFSAIANKGVLMKPQILDGTPSEELRRVILEETAGQISAMMMSAVEKAEVASITGYEIAGKTGTAQVPDFKNGGYTENFIHTYVGFAPVSNPKFTVLIKLDKPRGVTLAGATVVPAFRELVQFLLNYYNIPPDA